MISPQREDQLLKLFSAVILITILLTTFLTWRMPILRAMHAIPEPYGHFMTLALEDWVAPEVFVDGQQVIFSSPRALLVRETTLVPAKRFLDSLPAKVKYNWDFNTQTLTITSDDKTIKLTVGQAYGWVDEDKYRLEQIPRQAFFGEYAYIPLKFVLEALNYQFTYDHDKHVVQIFPHRQGSGRITEPPEQAKPVAVAPQGGKVPEKVGGSTPPPVTPPVNPPAVVKPPSPPPPTEKQYSDGGRYVGDLRNGVRDGNGVMYYANGNRYEGPYKNDSRQGYGRYYWSDGGKFEGEFRNDTRNGSGKYVSPSGYTYEGDYRDDKPNGQGQSRWSNGDRYVGQFANGLPHGQGTYYWANGQKHVGEFVNDKITGWGTRYYTNGETRQGRWENGNLVGGKRE